MRKAHRVAYSLYEALENLRSHRHRCELKQQPQHHRQHHICRQRSRGTLQASRTVATCRLSRA